MTTHAAPPGPPAGPRSSGQKRAAAAPAVGPRHSFFSADPARRALESRLEAADGNLSELAQVLRLDRGTVSRLLHRSRLRYDAADAIAVALGCHPVELWPEWFDGLAAPAAPATGGA